MRSYFFYNVVFVLLMLSVARTDIHIKIEKLEGFSNTNNDSDTQTLTKSGTDGADIKGSSADCADAVFTGDVSPTFEVVFPVISRREGIRSMNTFNEDTQLHRRHLVIRFTYKGEKHKLKLHHNSKLMVRKNTNSRNHYEQREDCYYQGYCSKGDHLKSENSVSLSTCDGISGVIQIDGVAHVIYPYKGSADDMLCRPHVVYKMSTTKDRSCGNQSGQWSLFEKLHKIQKFPVLKSNRMRRDADTKYLELALIMDKSLYEKHGLSEDEASKFVLQVTNIVDMYYQSLNIRVGLVYSEFWTEDKVSISSNPRETLQNFLKFTESQLHVSYDLVHLISGQSFDGSSSGLAIPDSICTRRGVAVVSSQSVDNSRHLANVIAHMIGHSIGLLHDTNDCVCEDIDSGCIMNPNIGSKLPTMFSSCSVSRLEVLTSVGLGSCLLEEPIENPFPQSCGNGFVERGEQCDCGLAANCEKVDPCCDPLTCLLKPFARCSSGTCCEGCFPKQSNEVCRPADGECDAAEYCDGISGECPADSSIANGQFCSEGYCYNGRCPSRNAQCKQFWNSGSTSAHDECYNFNNPLGNPYGHCGLDDEGNSVKCALQDSLCGLLQCKGGESFPVQNDLGVRTTSAGTNGNEPYQCKTVTANPGDHLAGVGMVLDGSKCGDNLICVGYECVSSSAALGHSECPKGRDNTTCSGNGRCTTVQTCSCNYGYRGSVCNEILPTSSSRDSVVTPLSSVPPGGSTLDVKWLIVIICVVTAAVVSAAIVAFLFCRRQVVSPSRKKANKRKQSHLNESMDLERSRAISFGQTPTYRSEKDGKRKRRRKRRPSSSGEDETDSDERPSAVPVDIVIPEELSRQPERGILKKSTSSAFEGLEDECHSQCSCTDTGSCSCSDHELEQESAAIPGSTGEEPEQEIPPPREFDTNMYSKRFETNVQIEVNPCQEVSPTDSEHMKYCAPEVDQFYNTFTPSYDKYNSVLPPQSLQGGDSATDSAIDMPAEGSVSTINDIAPQHHSTAIFNNSSYYKHRPTVVDYLDIQSDDSHTDSRPSRLYKPPIYIKPSLPSFSSQSQNTFDLQEYKKPPVNRSLDNTKQESTTLCTFKSSRAAQHTSRPNENMAVDDSITV